MPDHFPIGLHFLAMRLAIDWHDFSVRTIGRPFLSSNGPHPDLTGNATCDCVAIFPNMSCFTVIHSFIEQYYPHMPPD